MKYNNNNNSNNNNLFFYYVVIILNTKSPPNISSNFLQKVSLLVFPSRLISTYKSNKPS